MRTFKRILITFVMIAIITGTVFSQNGIIREFTGSVEIKPAGVSDFLPAQRGMEVAQNTIVSTGIRSTAVIVVGSNTIVVRPITRLSLSEIQASSNDEKLNVNLQAGRIRIEVKPPAGTRASTTVQTPSATASVRGTEFDASVDSFNVLEGTVFVQDNTGLGVSVAEGSGTTVNEDGIQSQTDTNKESIMPKVPDGSGLSGEKIGTASKHAKGVVQLFYEWDGGTK